MSISSVASNIWSSATIALTAPSVNLTPVSTGSTSGTSGSTSAGTAANTPTSTDPFQQLASTLQAWLTQLQSNTQNGQTSASTTDTQQAAATTSTDAAATTGSTPTDATTGTAKPHGHHHHSGGDQADSSQFGPNQSDINSNMASSTSTQSIVQALQSYTASMGTSAAATSLATM